MCRSRPRHDTPEHRDGVLVGDNVKVEIDADVCAGHGVCVGLVPDVFELSVDGYSVVKVDEVPAEQESAVRAAADQCPTDAITITP